MATGTDELLAEITALGQEAGLDAIGVAPADPFESTRHHLEERKAGGLHGGMHFTYGDPGRSTTPSRVLPGAKAIVVGARSYRRSSQVARTAGRPWASVARYSWRDHYEPLRVALNRIAARLEAAGYAAVALADDNALVDREAAYRAGIGWYGKNTNILVPGAGSWFVLGSVVTDAPLAPAARPLEDGCGSCQRCLPACPTGALVAPGVLDARRCLAWLLEAPGTFPPEYRSALGDRIYGCDDCQEACPLNRILERGDAAPAAEPDAEPLVDVVGLLRSTDEELLDRFGRWYIPRRQPRFLRRNALVVLGNTADGADDEVGSVLATALEDPDPIVRGHAVWAAARLNRGDLLTRLEGEADEGVLGELAAAPAPR